MKNITLAFTLVFLVNISFAQEETEISNKFVLGGSFNLSAQSNSIPISSLGISSNTTVLIIGSGNEATASYFSITPYFGKEINQNWLFAVSMHFRRSTDKFENILIFGQSSTGDIERTTNQLGIGIFSRYTFNPDHKLQIYMQPFIEYNTGKRTEFFDSDLTYEEKGRFINLGLTVGGLYSINEKFRATLRAGLLNYLKGSWEEDGSNTKNDFVALSANFNLSSIRLGFEMRM